MAETFFDTTDNLTRKTWARDLFKVLLWQEEIAWLLGDSDEAIIQVRKELLKSKGDQITFGILKELTEAGIVGTAIVQGTGEKQVFRNFNMKLEERWKAVNAGQKSGMSEQRVPYNLLETGKRLLKNWWGQQLSDHAINVLCGNSNFKVDGQATFGQTVAEPTTNQIIRVNDAASDAALTAGDICTLGFLDRMKQRAENPIGTDYKVRMATIKGKRRFVIILHNFVFDALRRNTNKLEWGDLQREAGKFEIPNVEIDYNDMLVMKSKRIYSPNANATTGAGAYRNLFLGAQAGVWGWGGAGLNNETTMAYNVELYDHKRKIEVAGGAVYGVRKTSFSDTGDYGVIVGASYGQRLSG